MSLPANIPPPFSSWLFFDGSGFPNRNFFVVRLLAFVLWKDVKAATCARPKRRMIAKNFMIRQRRYDDGLLGLLVT